MILWPITNISCCLQKKMCLKLENCEKIKNDEWVMKNYLNVDYLSLIFLSSFDLRFDWFIKITMLK